MLLNISCIPIKYIATNFRKKRSLKWFLLNKFSIVFQQTANIGADADNDWGLDDYAADDDAANDDDDDDDTMMMMVTPLPTEMVVFAYSIFLTFRKLDAIFCLRQCFNKN